MTTTIGGAGPYRLTGGTQVSFMEAARAKPGILRELSPQEAAALGVRTGPPETSEPPPPSRPERIHGQVTVHGRVVATVFESGLVLAEREIEGLSDGGAGPGLANARLQEIAKVLGGEIRRNDFLGAEELLQLMNWDSIRSQQKA